MENEIKDFHPGDESINKSIDILLRSGVDFISGSKAVRIHCDYYKDAIISHCDKYPNDTDLGREIRKWASKF